MQDGDHATLLESFGNGPSEHVGFGERYCTGILHGASVEIWHEELVVLFKRVRVVEGLLEEHESFASLFEHVVGFEILLEGCTAVNAQRNHATVRRGQFAVT